MNGTARPQPRQGTWLPGLRLQPGAVWRLAAWAGVALTLALVFFAWLNPHLAVDLANAVWSCF